MDLNFLKQILILTNNLITGNFEAAKSAAEQISVMELTEENVQNIKDVLRTNGGSIDSSQLEQLIDVLKLECKDVLMAIIELEKVTFKINQKLSVEEIKQLKAYTLAKSGSIEDESDKYNILYGLSMLAITARDSAFILEILELME